jgi:hypothetical protein
MKKVVKIFIRRGSIIVLSFHFQLRQKQILFFPPSLDLMEQIKLFHDIDVHRTVEFTLLNTA